MIKILITGSDGFIAKNLLLRLSERSDIETILFNRESDPNSLIDLMARVDFIFHLAGVNRPQDLNEFEIGNIGLTKILVEAVKKVIETTGNRPKIIFTSSTQAELFNPYGKSKQSAERIIFDFSDVTGTQAYVFRLPNVFGKWARPNYNSVIATFCYNLSRDIPIIINDPKTHLNLVYVEDLIDQFMAIISNTITLTVPGKYVTISNQYQTTVGELANQLKSFKESRNNLKIDRVGVGLKRALYSTYVSYLPLDGFSYDVSQHSDSRGKFVEMLKTSDSGQFSFFTAYPGVTRGGHYHNSKTEKFLVIKGQALFRFKHMLTGECCEISVTDEISRIVETVPGWAHDITNIGKEEMVVMLWANEVFDQQHPDTFKCPVVVTASNGTK